jgi:hypothetical protein
MGTTPAEHQEPGPYEFRVKGHIDSRWASWFEGLALRHEHDETTTLRGAVTDQAAMTDTALGWLRCDGPRLVRRLHAGGAEWAAVGSASPMLVLRTPGSRGDQRHLSPGALT